jgi:cytosine/uracil/thiamine/allantoin permease
MGVVEILGGVKIILEAIAPMLSVILIIAGGIVYGVAQAQPAEVRGKWQSLAVSLFVGGIVIAVIAGGAEFIKDNSLLIIGNETA